MCVCVCVCAHSNRTSYCFEGIDGLNKPTVPDNVDVTMTTPHGNWTVGSAEFIGTFVISIPIPIPHVPIPIPPVPILIPLIHIPIPLVPIPISPVPIAIPSIPILIL